MIIHLRNQDDAEKLPRELIALAYLITYECANDTIAVVKWRSATGRLCDILKRNNLISREDYKELHDFIINTFYKKHTSLEE